MPTWGPRGRSPRRRCVPSTPAPSRCPAPPSRPLSPRCATARPSGPWSRSRARSRGVVTATLDDLATGNGPGHPGGAADPHRFSALLARPGTGLGDIKRIGGHPAVHAAVPWLARRQPAGQRVGAAGRPTPRRPVRPRTGRWMPALAGAFAASPVRPGRPRPRRARPGQRRDPVRRGVPTRAAARAPPARTAPRWPRSWPRTTRARCSRSSPSSRCAAINLTTIQSRPTGDRLGQYYFFVDCEGHVDDARVGRGADGAAPGLPRGTLPRQLRAVRWRVHSRQGRVPRTPSSPRPPPGWGGCAFGRP